MALPRSPYPAILSASRRTDIPAFYLDWFMESLAKGSFEVENPYNRRIRQIPARPHEVHSIVLWSKNFGPFLDQHIGEKLERRGYRLFFNFTVNATTPDLEPHVPTLNNRLAQLEELAARFGPHILLWRFDPVCFYRRQPAAALQDNLTQLATIAATASRAGLQQCITSFVDLYPKVQKRARRAGIHFEDPSTATKVHLLKQMAGILSAWQIRLSTCCEKQVVAQLPPTDGIRNGACIPGKRLARIYGEHLNLRRDRGQRVKAGCGCNLAIDIGSYQRQPCYHDCLFCYARPQAPRTARSADTPEA